MVRWATLIDIGANLTSKTFQRDLPAVIDRAAAAGVHTLIVTGTSLAGSHAAAALTERPARAALYATAGVHPHHALEATAAGDWLGAKRRLPVAAPRATATAPSEQAANR